MCACDLIFKIFAVVIRPLSHTQWNMKEVFNDVCVPVVALIVWRCRGVTSEGSRICSLHLVGILFLLFLNCRIISVSKKKKKLSTYFHFLFFQPVGVVIMEHCRVTDNCLVLSARSARSGYKLFPLLPKSSPTAGQSRHGPQSSLWSAEVISVNQTLTWGSFHSEVQPKYSRRVGRTLPVMKHWGIRQM